jgi:hypothetical protein
MSAEGVNRYAFVTFMKAARAPTYEPCVPRPIDSDLHRSEDGEVADFKVTVQTTRPLHLAPPEFDRR